MSQNRLYTVFLVLCRKECVVGEERTRYDCGCPKGGETAVKVSWSVKVLKGDG